MSAEELKAIGAGLAWAAKNRFTLRYPEQRLELPDGWKGRHLLFLDKCTGCTLCDRMCVNITNAIKMVEVKGKTWPQNKRSLFPHVDYGQCCFCGLCVDACPFDAIVMTKEYELSGYDKKSLVYSPDELAVPPTEKKNLRAAKIRRLGPRHEPTTPKPSITRGYTYQRGVEK